MRWTLSLHRITLTWAPEVLAVVWPSVNCTWYLDLMVSTLTSRGSRQFGQTLKYPYLEWAKSVDVVLIGRFFRATPPLVCAETIGRTLGLDRVLFFSFLLITACLRFLVDRDRYLEAGFEGYSDKVLWCLTSIGLPNFFPVASVSIKLETDWDVLFLGLCSWNCVAADCYAWLNLIHAWVNVHCKMWMKWIFWKLTCIHFISALFYSIYTVQCTDNRVSYELFRNQRLVLQRWCSYPGLHIGFWVEDYVMCMHICDSTIFCIYCFSYRKKFWTSE